MTNQEAFNIAYLGLKKQGWVKSVNEKNNCVYRGPRGLKCAIGHLISDELYNKTGEYDGWSWKASAERYAKEIGLEGSFANFLQSAHDCSGPIDPMKSKMERLAEHYNLEIPKD